MCPHSLVVRPHPDTSLDTNSHIESRSCWEDRSGLCGETEEGGFKCKIKGFGKGNIQEGRIHTGSD